MTIRARLTLWYASILTISVVMIVGLSLIEFFKERAAALNPQLGPAENDGWEDAATISLSCGIPAALIGLTGGWWLMRKALTPVTNLTLAAARIHEQNLAEQLPRTGNGDELDQLTAVFNAMTIRLAASFNRIREFTLHASHELKTPLTVMRGELETSLAETLEPEARERLLSQLDEIDRLTKIVDGLTWLTKADAGLIQLRQELVQLDELVRESFADAQILARPHQIRVALTRCEAGFTQGDRHRLRQLFLNLTDNAIKYNEPLGVVEISLTKAGSEFELRISNSGKGIQAEKLERIFDRFYRGDDSHSSQIEGCGLGLSIAKWIVQAHGGSIRIESSPGQHTMAIVRLPLIQPPSAPAGLKSAPLTALASSN